MNHKIYSSQIPVDQSVIFTLRQCTTPTRKSQLAVMKILRRDRLEFVKDVFYVLSIANITTAEIYRWKNNWFIEKNMIIRLNQ
jgi:hypothetical protein